ncbi:hypothetical protein ACWGDE_07100 [Streptomyces sp. NPDC054956]
MTSPHPAAAPRKPGAPHVLHRIGSALLALAGLVMAAGAAGLAIGGAGILAYGGGALACVRFACWMALVAFRRRLTLTGSELLLVQLVGERSNPLDPATGLGTIGDSKLVPALTRD